ncbi:hypothetical protein TNCT_298651 [Trichonephila clavata]|uniref:Uncharacterized protein n=1 Tax=Trichonephila clavata TaxID=2740835 RepID=A0A8X6KRQ8_TRICU|nr:hypothetical protein TNCT_298651 [Trichonephila clavata]
MGNISLNVYKTVRNFSNGSCIPRIESDGSIDVGKMLDKDLLLIALIKHVSKFTAIRMSANGNMHVGEWKYACRRMEICMSANGNMQVGEWKYTCRRMAICMSANGNMQVGEWQQACRRIAIVMSENGNSHVGEWQ